MIFLSIIILILITALPSFFNNLPENCYNRISAIVLLFCAILTFQYLNIESIGSGIAIYGGLFHKNIISQFKHYNSSNTTAENGGNTNSDKFNKSFAFGLYFKLITFNYKKSAFLDIDILNFDSLTVYQKISVFLILSDTLIFSCLISIVFIFYGDYLIKKYELENKYPRLAKLINLRLKFKKYYFIFNILIITSVLLIQTLFSLAVLNL